MVSCSKGPQGGEMAYLAALSSSAMDIFIRTKGNVPPLSFWIDIHATVNVILKYR